MLTKEEIEEDILAAANSSSQNSRRSKKSTSQGSQTSRFGNLKDKVLSPLSRSSDKAVSRSLPPRTIDNFDASNNHETKETTLTRPRSRSVSSQQESPRRAIRKPVPSRSPSRHERPTVLAKDGTSLQNHNLSSPTPLKSEANGHRFDEMPNDVGRLQAQLRQAREDVARREEELKILRDDIQTSDIARREVLAVSQTLRKELYDESERRHREMPHGCSVPPTLENLSENEWAVRVKHLTWEVNSLEKQLNLCNVSITLLNKEMAAVQRDAVDNVRQSRKDISDLESEMQSLAQESDQEILSLKQERDDMRAEKDRTRQQLDKLVLQLASQASIDVYHFDDMYFQSQFSILRGNIKDWAHRAFSTSQKAAPKVPGTSARAFDAITSNWESYMGTDDHRPAFIQAYTWTYLLAKLFGGRAWETGPAPQPFQRLLIKNQIKLDDNPEHLNLYHEWRLASARFAAPHNTEKLVLEGIKYQLIGTAKELQAPLEPWLAMGKSQSTEMLFKVVREALQLDLHMQQQRAYLALKGMEALQQKHNGLFDASTMEIRFGRPPDGRERYIELVVAPLLMKCGTSEGGDYDHTVIIEKAQVDVEVPRKKFIGIF